MASKRVGFSPFLPTTESDSYIEREIVRMRQTKSERKSERTCFREIDLERYQVSERERERESVRERERQKRGRTGESVR